MQIHYAFGVSPLKNWRIRNLVNRSFNGSLNEADADKRKIEIDFLKFILLSRESDGSALHKTNSDSLRVAFVQSF